MTIRITHLYPLSMSTYGDDGNISCLLYRLKSRGISATVSRVDIGDPLPYSTDLYFFGGGQDASQSLVADDFLSGKSSIVLKDVIDNVPLLAICGGYQLLGNEYLPDQAPAIKGAGLFPVTTTASSKRMIGDVVLTAETSFGFETQNTLVGFENHSGMTFISDNSKCSTLGTVVFGNGNNGEDKSEGCKVHNAIGCYLHGPVLPKNPHLADWLLQKAVNRVDPDYVLQPLDDKIEWTAHLAIVGRCI